MQLTREDASQALGEIDSAGRRMREVRNYGHAAPFLILWGVIWLCGNTATDVDPVLGGQVWAVGGGLGCVITLWQTVRQVRAADPRTQAAFKSDRKLGFKIGMTWLAIWAFIAGGMTIMLPFDGRQSNAFISLLWACIYIAMGAWAGWRLSAIGLATAAAVLAGYHLIDQHYALWMGIVGGGSLIGGGLWLRKL